MLSTETPHFTYELRRGNANLGGAFELSPSTGHGLLVRFNWLPSRVSSVALSACPLYGIRADLNRRGERALAVEMHKTCFSSQFLRRDLFTTLCVLSRSLLFSFVLSRSVWRCGAAAARSSTCSARQKRITRTRYGHLGRRAPSLDWDAP